MAEPMHENRDRLARTLFGETLEVATFRVIGALAAASIVIGTLAWLIT